MAKPKISRVGRVAEVVAPGVACELGLAVPAAYVGVVAVEADGCVWSGPGAGEGLGPDV